MHLAIDESYRGNTFLMCGVLIPSGDVAPTRSMLKRLRPRRAPTIHFSKCDDAKRKEVIRELTASGGLNDVIVVVVEGNTQKAARRIAMSALIRQIDLQIVKLITIDRVDQATAKKDVEALRRVSSEMALSIRHQDHSQEPLLWIADGVAWCAGHPTANNWLPTSVRKHAIS